MKKNTFLLLILASCLGYGQTTLNPGDIAITGFNSDAPDQFSFVLLNDVTTGTEIKFTDNGLQTINYNVTDEGIITWTSTTDLLCGTKIIIEDLGANNYSATYGTAVESGAGFALAAAGDQILAYQGADATPSFIYAITYGPTTWADADNTQTSTLPPGLTDGQEAVYVGNDENGYYDCSVTSDQALILAAVSTNTNWVLSNAIVTLGTCTYTCTPCLTTVIWNGAWSGTPDLTTAAIIDAPYNAVIDGSFSACRLTINAGNTLTIPNNSYVEIQNDVIVEGDLTIASQGSLVQNNDNATFIDNSANGVTLTKTKTINNWYTYTYWSSPMSNETIENALGTTPADRRFEFIAANFVDVLMEASNDNNLVAGSDDIDDDGNDWQGATGTMTPGVGYAATAQEIVGPGGYPQTENYIFTGSLNNGVITVPLVNNSTTPVYNDWNFIGNPYASAISADQFFTVNAGIVNAIYLWDQATPPNANTNGNQGSNFSTDDYAIINAGTGEVGARGDTGTPPNRYVPTGQGFFVEALAASNITFNNSMRVTGNNDQFFRTKNKKNNANRLWVNMHSDNGAYNQILIGYVNGASNDYDGTYYDTPRNLSSGNASILYSIIEESSKKFAIQGKDPLSLDENETVKIGFKTSIDVPTIYSISIPQIEGDFLNNNPIVLKDNLLNTSHDLKNGNYNFTSEVGEFNDRFEIVFNSASLSNDDLFAAEKTLSIFEHKNGDVQFKLSSNSTQMKNIQIIDLQGRTIYNFDVDKNDSTHQLSALSQTPYIAKVTLNNNQTIIKKAIKKY
jgi:hypothetical protein